MAAKRKYTTEAERRAAKQASDRASYERRKTTKQAQNPNLNPPNQNPLSSPWNQNAPLSSINEPTVLNAVNAEPADVTPRTLGRNEKKYQKLLDDYLGPATGILILVLCLFVYRFDMESSEKIADYLAMNQQEQDLIIPPLASLMDKQGWDEETRNRILQSGDYIGLGFGLISYSTRVLGTLRELKGHINGNSGNAAQQAASAANGAGGTASSNGHDIAWGNQLAGLSQYAA